VKANVSAEAMDIAATRTDAKAEIYMDNMRQSMQRCGEIYLSMARDVYVEEGREVPTLSEDGKEPRHRHAATRRMTTTRAASASANDLSAASTRSSRT
jgi:hypothetical protein